MNKLLLLGVMSAVAGSLTQAQTEQLWKPFPADTALGSNGNWVGAGNPIGDAATLVGVIDGSANIQPSIQFGGQLNSTSLVLNNGATLTNPATLNAVGATVVLNQDSSFNSAGQTMAWGQNAGTVSTLTLNDTASLSALHLQVGKISQGIVNQNGGTVTLTGDLRLGLDAAAASASRYNLAAGTATVAGAFSVGGTDAGADGGTYFNFTWGSTGSLVSSQSVEQLNTKIDAGQIRVADVAYASSDAIWLMDSSVPGQTTLSFSMPTQLWKAFPTDNQLGSNGNWVGAGNPIGDAATLVGVIDGSATNQPSIGFGGQLNSTSLVLNNGATLTNPATLNAVGATVVLNQDSSFNSAGQTMAWGQNAGTVSTLTLNDTASLSALHLQVGKISQGIVNQNGGTVTLTGDLRLGLDAGSASASRYNLAAGTVTATGAFSVGGTDAGANGGTYFNFTAGSTGSLVSSQSVEQLNTKIDAGQIRVADVAYASSDAIWLMDSSVPEQTTLSLDTNPGLDEQFWNGSADSVITNNANWTGVGSPIGAAGAKIGVISDNGANAPQITASGQVINTEIVVNNSAVLTSTVNLNANGTILTLDDDAEYDNTGFTIKWGQLTAGETSILTINDNASVSSLHFQLGNVGQGIVNQNGGTVSIAGDLDFGFAPAVATASRYNLSAGTVTVGDEFDFGGPDGGGGTDSGIDGGTYFNFTTGSTGSLTISGTAVDMNTRIDNGWIRINDTAVASGDTVWSLVESGGNATLSLYPEGGNPFALWKDAKGLTSGVNDAPADDPDADGDNLYEYFFWDSDPLVADVFGSELTGVDGSGALSGNLVFTHDQPQDIGDVTVTYQWTTDLGAGWTNDGVSDGTNTISFATGTAGAPANGNSDDYRSVEVTASVTAGVTPTQIFVRVSVTLP